MARRPRIIIPGLAHHFTHRGNNRQSIFDTDNDRLLFLQLLAKYSERYELEIWGYCLMPNHYHLIAVPQYPEAPALTFNRLHADYARFLNIHRNASGHLWQTRFFATAMAPAYTWRALAYVERNPVRAGIVPAAQLFRWSSAPARLGLTAPPKWLTLNPWRTEWNDKDWNTLLADAPSEPALSSLLHTSTTTGRPLGTTAPPRSPGRPRIRRALTAVVL